MNRFVLFFFGAKKCAPAFDFPFIYRLGGSVKRLPRGGSLPSHVSSGDTRLTPTIRESNGLGLVEKDTLGWIGP